ncbi:MAG TPA: hypothetical protein VLT86_13165 [Vicinamibacterales bacterium]|nr:hypothetical protein [Vicinamibacterales bacterium]
MSHEADRRDSLRTLMTAFAIAGVKLDWAGRAVGRAVQDVMKRG